MWLLRAAAVALLFSLCACGAKPGVQGDVDGGDGGDGGATDGGGPDGGSVDGGPLCAPDPPPPPLGPATVTAGLSDRFLLKGRVVTPDDVFDPGEVLVVGTRIACVGTCAADAQAAGATTIDTRGVIFPGLVDAHNHTQYDYLPVWTPSPSVFFNNRAEWAARADYKAWTSSVNDNEADHKCEQVKYGEIRALVGGTTTIQGTYNSDLVCFRTLVHNAEYAEGGAFPNKMRTNIPGIDTVKDDYADTLRTGMGDGSITAYVIHLAEGVDASSKGEFTKLVAKGLLMAPTVIIHGTALGAAEFLQMAAAHAKLVWSPQSNLILYDATTDVPAALAAGVSVSLAPDWTLSGGPTQLHELKAARQISCDRWAGLLDAKALVKMVTSTPADALALPVGRLAPGLLADLLVIRDRGLDPYRTLVEAHLADVRMVMIGGNLRYGDSTLVALATPTGRPCEALPICGEDKRLCVPDTTDPDPTYHLDEGLVQILQIVRGFYANALPIDTCP